MKRIVRVDPGPGGVGQTVTFDDGSTEFDAFGTAKVDPTIPAGAPPATVDPTPPRAVLNVNVPDAAQSALGPEFTASQQKGAQEAIATGKVPPNAPPKPAQGPGEVPRLEPGIADALPPAPPEQPAPIIQGVRPGSPGGFQPSSMSIQGVREQERNQMYETAAAGLDAKQQGDEESIQAQEGYISGLEIEALNRYLKAEANALAVAADIKRQELVNAQIQTKLKDVSDFKPDRGQLFEGTTGGFRAALAGLGMIAGGMLAGLQGGPNHALEAVFKMIDDNVRDQVAQNAGIYQELVRRLGDEQAATSALKGKHLQATADMASALEMTAKTKEMKTALAGARQRAQFEATQYALKVQQALAPQEALNMAYRAPTPATIFTIDRDQEQLKGLLGPDADKQVKEFMLQKTSGQQNAKTVGEALQYMKELQSDQNILRGIAAANGGRLPGIDQVISPAQSPMMRQALARLGIEKSVAAGDVYKIVNSLVMKRARSYGGAVTESDAKAAGQEVGVTSGQVVDFMTRMYQEANGHVKGVAYGYFQGRSQPVIDILTHGVGAMQGLRSDRGNPRVPEGN